MKVKSLLVAAAAVVALGMSAQPTVSMPDIDLTDPANVNTPIEMPMVLNMPDGDDFTNIQIHLVFPEAVRPYFDEENECCGYAGSGIKKKAGAPVVSYSDNMYVHEDPDDPTTPFVFNEAFYPEFDIIGANMSKTPNTTNPNEFYVLNVICDPDTKAGQFKMYLKYTKSNEEAVALGTAIPGENPEVDPPVYTELYTPEGGNIIAAEVAVNDVNVTKAISSVTYYNAAGMASETAFDGINIVVTKYVDGSQSTAKVVK